MTGREEAMLSVVEVVASFKQTTISKSVMVLRIDEGISDFPAVEAPTNDMGQFPSGEYPLSPGYVSRDYSWFKYTTDTYGIVTVHTEASEASKLLGWADRILALFQIGGEKWEQMARSCRESVIVKCAWCAKELGEKPPYEDKRVTHSICGECRAKHFPGRVKDTKLSFSQLAS